MTVYIWILCQLGRPHGACCWWCASSDGRWVGLVGVLRSDLDSLHPGIGLEAAGSTVPVTQGLVDGVSHRVRGECFDMAQSNPGSLQPLCWNILHL